jgi:hypothetical protein
MGYYVVFLGLQYKNDIAMIQKLDRGNYQDSQTVTIKIPITVPYISDSRSFERVDGKFEYNGEFYRLVKQKYAQDTLTIICVKDNHNKRIHQALSSYLKSFSDKPSDENHSKLVITFIKDYIPQNFALKTFSMGWQVDLVRQSAQQHLIPTFFSSIIHPPERG